MDGIVPLINLGNTCYINSVLQCFINDPIFIDGIKELLKTNGTNELLLELTNLLNNGNNGNNGYNLSYFIKFFPYFKKYQQNDSHEFLISFLDLITRNVNNPEQFNNIYHGQTRNSIKCTCCGTVTHTIEDFNSINLNIPISESILPLEDLLINYLKKETNNDPNNLFFCNKCNRGTVSEQKIVLWKLPKRLIIVLKRYSGNSINKIQSIIKYPTEKMIIRESISSGIINYSLSGLVIHLGDMYNGHYMSIIKKNDSNYIINDSEISNLSTINNSNKNAYILIYSIIG